MEQTLPGHTFDARLDESGNLYVSAGDVARLRGAFRQHADPSFVAMLEAARRRRCSALLEATRAAHVDDASRAAGAAAHVLERVADVMPYAILTKFVPGLLRDAVLASGTTDVPGAPSPSPGLQLTRSLTALAGWLRSRGVAPEDAARDWPEVPTIVSGPVRSFCTTHSGFGPVAWEAPGFDEPTYALRAMTGLGLPAATRAGGVPPRFDGINPAVEQPLDLAGTLVGWLEFTELQIWYVRSAFYRAIVPLLERLAAAIGIAPHRLLFLTRHEIAGDAPPATEIDARMARYTADSAYLARNSIAPGRLPALFRDIA